MSLIKCSECNQDVSTLGAVCPHCGNPIASKAVPQPVVSLAAKSITSLASGAFLGVLIGIAVAAVFIFAPERLPPGIGLVPVPMEVRTRPSLVGEGQVAIISNPTGKTLHNVHLFCRNSSTNEEKAYFEETWAPGKSLELGWLEEWKFLSGETLTISASGYASKTWNW